MLNLKRNLMMRENLEKEEWRIISDNRDYEVSSFGRVRNKETKVIEEIHAYKRNGTNYKSAMVRNRQLSRIVARAFPDICGEWFGGCQVHHLDENPLNNHADNLKVCTKEEHDAYHYEERRQRCIERCKGMKGTNHPMFGKKHSEETRRKISGAKRGKNLSEETKRKMRMNRKDMKPVYQYSLDGKFIRKWDSAREIERVLEYKHSNISSVCLGKLSSAYGYIWKHKRMN